MSTSAYSALNLFGVSKLLGFILKHHVRIQRQTNKEKWKQKCFFFLYLFHSLNYHHKFCPISGQSANLSWCWHTDMFVFVGRYERFQLFAHQLLWIVDVCGLWQIPSWERTAWGVGEQSWVSPCLHGAGTEAKQPPQLTHTHMKTRPHANKSHKHMLFLFCYFRNLVFHIILFNSVIPHQSEKRI